MPAFAYIAVDERGKKHKGVTQADSQKQARQYIRDRGYMPYSIELAGGDLKKTQSLGAYKRQSLSTYDLCLVTRQLGTMIQSGLAIDDALAAAASQTDKNKIKELLLAIRSSVLEGESLATALARYPKAFPHMFHSTVAAGEKSGKLGLIMNRLADYTEASAEFQQKISMALIYPSLLLFISVVIVSGLMIYVVPDVIQVFIDSGQELPYLTMALMNLSAFLEKNGFLLFAFTGIFIVFLVYCLKLPRVLNVIHYAQLKTPLVKRFSRNYNAVRYVGTLHILCSSGVPLVEAMKIAAEVAPNLYLKNRLKLATNQVTEGMTLNKALQNVQYIPPIFVHMIASGETSGELNQMLERSASSQEKELQRWISTMLGMFEPLTLIIMGFVVMLIVLAILLPILNMNQLIV